MRYTYKVSLASAIFCCIVILPSFIKTLLDTINYRIPLQKGILVLIGDVLLVALYFFAMHLIHKGHNPTNDKPEGQ